MADGAGLNLSKQVGPLPMGAWIALVGGGLGIAWYINKQNGAPADPGVDTGGVPGVGDGTTGGWTSTQPAGDSTPAGPQTNEAWAVLAINWLIAQGYDATTADSAIRKYIAGSDPGLSVKEWALLSLALGHFGSPPNPLPPPVNGPPSIPPPATTPPPVTRPPGYGTNPPPSPPIFRPPPVIPPPPSQAPPPVTQPPPAQKPPPAPSPSAVHWDTVTPWPSRTSTLWGMASKWYNNGSKWPVIYNANKKGTRRPDGSMGMITNPDLLFAGWRIYIPNA